METQTFMELWQLALRSIWENSLILQIRFVLGNQSQNAHAICSVAKQFLSLGTLARVFQLETQAVRGK